MFVTKFERVLLSELEQIPTDSLKGFPASFVTKLDSVLLSKLEALAWMCMAQTSASAAGKGVF